MHFRPISERKVSSVVNVLAEKSALVKNFLLSLPDLLRREWRSVLAVLSANIIFISLRQNQIFCQELKNESI